MAGARERKEEREGQLEYEQTGDVLAVYCYISQLKFTLTSNFHWLNIQPFEHRTNVFSESLLSETFDGHAQCFHFCFVDRSHL